MTAQTEHILTYVDACLLIAAFQNRSERDRRAVEVLGDRRRIFVTSDALWLEVMPKALFNKRPDEADFYADFFGRAQQRLSWNTATLQRAHTLASTYGLAAMDAIHIAFALEAGADQFISAENSGKRMFAVQEMPVLTIALK